jgi:cytosine/uracil/thiamine/allantoin permease
MDVSLAKNSSLSISLLSSVICFAAFLLIDIIFFAQPNESLKVFEAIAAGIATGGCTYFISKRQNQS